ncbi:hypothetical protein JHK87_018645 [Glycine soja]|nr:hypothetical protein JHK87_018645 [Glycine soja]
MDSSSIFAPTLTFPMQKLVMPFPAQRTPSLLPFPSQSPCRCLAFASSDDRSALSDPYFTGLANMDREPSTQPISKLKFEFERMKLTKDDVRELIYGEILEYHPQMLQEYLCGGDQTSFMYPRFLWMVRIGGGEYRVDKGVAPKMLNYLIERERGLIRMQFDVAELCFWQQSDSRGCFNGSILSPKQGLSDNLEKRFQ